LLLKTLASRIRKRQETVLFNDSQRQLNFPTQYPNRSDLPSSANIGPRPQPRESYSRACCAPTADEVQLTYFPSIAPTRREPSPAQAFSIPIENRKRQQTFRSLPVRSALLTGAQPLLQQDCDVASYCTVCLSEHSIDLRAGITQFPPDLLQYAERHLILQKCCNCQFQLQAFFYIDSSLFRIIRIWG